MKITVSRDHLSSLLSSVGAAAPTRSTLPVLSHVLLEAEGDSLRGMATDLDLVIRTQTPARVARPGAICAPIDTLRQIASKASPGDVELDLKDSKLTVRAGKAKLTVACLPAAEFPRPKEPGFEDPWLVPAKELFTAIDTVAYAVSVEATRPILNGVLWQVLGSEVRMIGTNGHRLAMASWAAPQGAEKLLKGRDVIVHPKALTVVRSIAAGAHMIEVAKNDNYLSFRAGGGTVSTRIIEGPFPPYDQVVPKENDKELIVDSTALRQAMERVAIMTATGGGTSWLTFNMASADSVHLSTPTSDRGGAEEEVEAKFSGDALRISFNAAYAIETLKKAGTDSVKLTFSNPDRAMLLLPVEQKNGLRTLFLQMPLVEDRAKRGTK